MTRLFLSILLMMAVLWIGAMPHAVRAGVPSEASASSQLHHPAKVDGGTDRAHSHGSGHDGMKMSEACVVICLGAQAIWAQPATAPVEFGLVVLTTPSALVLHGRPTDPADRPPISI